MEKETRENFLAVACENRFRVKLPPVQGEVAMPQFHYFSVVAFNHDLEACRKGTALNDQRVVSTGFKRRGQIGKESASVMSDRGLLPMYKSGSTHDFSAVRFGNALVSKTNTEHWNLRLKVHDDVFADSRFARSAGSRRDTDMLGC